MASEADGTLTAVFTSHLLNQRPWWPLTRCHFHLSAYGMGGEVLKIAAVILKKDHCFIRQEQTLVWQGAFTLPTVGAHFTPRCNIEGSAEGYRS